jgi:antitoxin component of MazEF toxin-antitoxin module
MKIVKVRRVGNSNVISIPREFEARGYAPGSSVLVEELPGGELRIMSTEKVRERIRDIGGRLVAEHGEALEPAFLRGVPQHSGLRTLATVHRRSRAR